MKRHWQYALYVFRHRWFVMVECFKLGLIWRGLVHDLSKFRPSEWFPYATHFFGPNSHHKDGSHAAKGIQTGRDKTGYYKPTDTGDPAFDFAWLLHQKRNRHHWQWWILPEDGGGVKILPIPEKYVEEMVCDWRGAGRAQGLTKDWRNPRPYFEANNAKMQLHPDTFRRIEVELTVGEKF